MSVFDAGKEKFMLIRVDGKICAFTNLRLDRKTIPDTLHCYDVRDSDLLDGTFAEISPFVFVNHWGTLVCREEFPLDRDGSYYPEDEEEFIGGGITLKEYMEIPLDELEEFINSKYNGMEMK